MSNRKPLDYSLNEPLYERLNPLQYIFKDIPLYVSLLAVLIFGLMMLYSSSGQSFSMVARQSIYISGGLVLMTLISHLKPDSYKNILFVLARSYPTYLCSNKSIFRIYNKQMDRFGLFPISTFRSS